MSSRKFCLLLCALVCAFGWVAGEGRAAAQMGVYGMVHGERVNNVVCVDPQGTCARTNGANDPLGGTFGVQYDLRQIGPVTLGADLRGSILDDSKRADLYAAGADFTRFYDVLAGARAQLTQPLLHIVRPYGIVSAGFARSNLQVSQATDYNPSMSYKNFGQAQVFLGTDVKIFPFLDFRAIEVGAGEMFGPANHTVLSIGSGVVLHLPSFGR